MIDLNQNKEKKESIYLGNDFLLLVKVVKIFKALKEYNRFLIKEVYFIILQSIISYEQLFKNNYNILSN